MNTDELQNNTAEINELTDLEPHDDVKGGTTSGAANLGPDNVQKKHVTNIKWTP